MCVIKKCISFFKLLICILAVYSFIFEFEPIKKEIVSAVTVWVNIIIPSVFPYLVLSKYITGSDILDIFEVFPGKLIGACLNISPCSIRAVICSLFCGYPSGAVCTVSLKNNDYIKAEEAQRLICFTNNAGPLFLVSAVGASMLGSIRDGFVIYIIEIISAFFYGAASSVKSQKKQPVHYIQKKNSTNLCEAVQSSVTTITNICGYMIAAYVLSRCVMIFADKINGNTPLPEWTTIIVKGFFEITHGVGSIATPCPNPLEFGIICGFVSWSGLSVIMQIKSVAGDIINFRSLIWAKFVQGVSSFCLGYGYKMMSAETMPNFQYHPTLKISLIITIILFIIYYIKTQKKRQAL